MAKSDQYRRLKRFDGVKPVVENFATSIRVTVSSITLLTAMVVCVVLMFSWVHLARIPNLSMLENYNPGAEMQLYDINDKLICTFPAKERREVIKLDQVSPYAIKAVLAAEDHYFYEHSGVSPVGILRAAAANLSAGKPVQGGSTLTQQLVKNIFYEESQRTLPLKLAEGIVASEVERRYGKEKILEIYLNQIYFGNGAYGIEQAARTYFGKHASQLSAAEGAFLAGLIKSPSHLGDRANLYSAMMRQRTVLSQMSEYGFITPLEAELAASESVIFAPPSSQEAHEQFVPPYPYYCGYVADYIKSSLSYTRHKGLKVYTNLDPSAQKAAEAVLASTRLPPGLDQAALVSLRLKDGAVLAIVGGLGDYLEHQWNCAVHPHTMGSSFKPFVYLSAFENGVITPYSQLLDGPLQVMDDGDKIWEPQNFDKKFMGMITAEEALVYSRNVCSVRIAQQIGLDTIIDTARRAGIKDELAHTLSLSLGSSAASPLTMAGAYSTIARGGMYIEPRLIRKMEDSEGHVLAEFEATPLRSLDMKATAELTDILKKVVESGTGTRSRLAGIPSAGKTGTADQSRDLWFVGFTADTVTAVWTGNSLNHPVKGHNITGGTVAAPIWKRYMTAFYRNHPLPREALLTDGAPSALPGRKNAEPAPVQAEYYQHHRQSRGKRSGRTAQPAISKPATGVTEYDWSAVRD